MLLRHAEHGHLQRQVGHTRCMSCGGPTELMDEDRKAHAARTCKNGTATPSAAAAVSMATTGAATKSMGHRLEAGSAIAKACTSSSAQGCTIAAVWMA